MLQRGAIKEGKNTARRVEKISANHISDPGLESKIRKDLSKLSDEKKPDLKNGLRIQTDFSAMMYP